MTTRYYTVRTKRRKLRTGRLLFVLALCAFLVTLLFSARFLNALNTIQDQSEWASALPEPVNGAPENIIIYSVSDNNNAGSVTCLVLATYHPAEKQFRAVNIPVETLLDVPEHGFKRVAQMYHLSGREQLLASVSELMNIPIHTYVEINEAFLPTALDRLGADIQSGLHIQNGGDILAVIHANGISPAEQLERRQIVMAYLAKEVLNAGTVKKLPAFLRVSPLIRTNMTWRKLFSSMEALKNTSFSGAVSVVELPGREEVQSDGRFWLPDAEQLPEMATWLNVLEATVPKAQISLEVLNGCGVAGLANEVAQMLRESGYNVIRVGNADHFEYDETQVISRTQSVDAAKEVAILLQNAQFLKEEIPGTDVYVTVILGKNYNQE